MQPRARAELVALLVAGRLPLEPIRDELSQYPWDSETPLAILRRENVAAILERFVAGQISATELSAWANAVELRDDIGFPDEDSALLSRIIFVLANPEIDGELSRVSVNELLASVR